MTATRDRAIIGISDARTLRFDERLGCDERLGFAVAAWARLGAGGPVA